MRIVELLQEGTIKVQPSVLQAAQATFLSALHAQLSAVAKKLPDKVERSLAEAGLRRLERVFKIAPAPELGRGKIVKRKQELELPERYLKKLSPEARRAVPKSYQQVLVFDGTHPLLDGTESGLFQETPPTMVISAPVLGLQPDKALDLILVGKIVELERRIKHGLSVIEHELTHATQFGALQRLHPSQVEGDSDVSKLEYFTSNLEFSPLLKTEIARYQRDPKGTIKIFTWSDKTPTESELKSLPAERSKLFGALKLLEPSKWRKAVKLFTQEVQDGISN